MKSSFPTILFLLVAMSSFAQQKQKAVSDTSKKVIYNTSTIRKTKATKSPEAEITEKLNTLVSTYINAPNTQAIWTQIKGEAENILLGYYRNGILMGTKQEQAFFVKMGNETMTASDIANRKMILQVGAAMVKPAEFKIIVIEKINTAR
jgi:phage tail sheath protein FI